MKLDDQIDVDTFERKKKQLDEEMQKLQESISLHEMTGDGFKKYVIDAFSISSRVYELFEKANLSERRELINCVFSDIILKGKNPQFSLRKPFNLMVDLSVCSDWLAERYTSRTKLFIHNALFDKEFGDMLDYNPNIKRDRILKTDSNLAQTFMTDKLLENIVVFSSSNYKNSFYDLSRNISRYERLA